MKSKIKYIACFAMVVITICLSTISAFGAGYYTEYVNEETGAEEYWGYSYLRPTLPIESMILYSRNNTGLETKREIYFQNNADAEHSLYNQSLPNSQDKYNTTITYTSTNNGIGSLRNMTKLKNLFVEKNSQLYNIIGLQLYDDTWQDIIRYSLPSTGISAIRTSGFHSNGNLELPINEITFDWYPEETINGKVGRYFKINISTDLGDFLFIDTKTGVFRNEFAIWSFRYGYDNPDNNFQNFIDKVYPLPENIDQNAVVDPGNFVIRDIVKNHIVFNLIANTSTANPNVSRIKLSANQRLYQWQVEDWVNAHNGYVDTIMTLYVNDPTFIRSQLFKIEYKIAPFVIKTASDFQSLSQNAPKLRKLTGMELTTNIEADIAFVSVFENLQTVNENGEITQFYTSMGAWQQSTTYRDTTTDGTLFFPNYRKLDIGGTIIFKDGDGLEHENPYSYNETPQPLLFTNMTITQDIDYSGVSNEHDYAGYLVYEVLYEQPNKYADTQISKYIINNTNFKGDGVQNYVKFSRGEFNPDPPSAWNLGDFFDGVLTFFNDPILGPFSIANILYVVIAIGVLFAILKYFAGG